MTLKKFETDQIDSYGSSSVKGCNLLFVESNVSMNIGDYCLFHFFGTEDWTVEGGPENFHRYRATLLAVYCNFRYEATG